MSAGLELPVLARRVSLSPAQLSQLESGEDSLFYNRTIRLQAARKVVLHLGGDPVQLLGPDSEPVPAPSPRATPEAVATRPVDVHMAARLDNAAQPASVPLAAKSFKSRSVFMGGLALSVLFFSLAYLAGDGRGAGGQASSSSEALTVSRPAGPAESGRSDTPSSAAQAAPPSTPPTPVESSALAPSPVGEGVARADTVGQAKPPACAATSDGGPLVRPPQASKPGDMVYVVSRISQVLCVTDASGQPRQHRFKAGEALSFYGQPPWQVQADNLRQTQLYFQGWKVRLPAQAQDRLQLVELK